MCVCVYLHAWLGLVTYGKVTSKKKKKELLLLVFQEYGRNFLYFDFKSSSNPIIEVSEGQQNLQ